MTVAVPTKKMEPLSKPVSSLRAASGDVLEVGFGFGAAVPHYPGDGAVRSLVGLDPNPGMLRRAPRHTQQLGRSAQSYRRNDMGGNARRRGYAQFAAKQMNIVTEIAQPEEFWSASKYLILVQD